MLRELLNASHHFVFHVCSFCFLQWYVVLVLEPSPENNTLSHEDIHCIYFHGCVSIVLAHELQYQKLYFITRQKTHLKAQTRRIQMKELIFICNKSASLGYVVFKQNWSLEQAEVSNRMSGQIYAVRQPMDKK